MVLPKGRNVKRTATHIFPFNGSGLCQTGKTPLDRMVDPETFEAKSAVKACDGGKQGTAFFGRIKKIRTERF